MLLVSILLSSLFSKYLGSVGALISILISLWSIYLVTLRLQDMNLSKWCAILVLLLLPLGLLFCAVVPGTKGVNKYGKVPHRNFDLSIIPGIKGKLG